MENTVEKDAHVTEVVFRKYKDGEILALFPYEMASFEGECDSYLHMGQHGGADYLHCIGDTKPATEEEYADLKNELEGIGYNLKVIKKRVHAKFLKAYYEMREKRAIKK